MVADAVKSTDEDESLHGQVILDIKSALIVQPDWNISFKYKEGNEAANKLAKIGLLANRN